MTEKASEYRKRLSEIRQRGGRRWRISRAPEEETAISFSLEIPMSGGCAQRNDLKPGTRHNHSGLPLHQLASKVFDDQQARVRRFGLIKKTGGKVERPSKNRHASSSLP